MSNYREFANFLVNLSDAEYECDFKEIEKKIGENLPNSAYLYDEWWSNSTSHPLMKQVLNIGWSKIELDLNRQHVKFRKNDGKIGNGELAHATNDTSFASWSKFETQARKAIEKELGVELVSKGIDINGKIKHFDLVNESEKIVGDVKNYATTKAGNIPVAKFSTLNEYVWQMGLLEKYSAQHWRKIFVIGEDLEMIKKYVKIFDKWLEDVEIYYFRSALSALKRIR